MGGSYLPFNKRIMLDISGIKHDLQLIAEETNKLRDIIKSFDSQLRVHKPWRRFKQVCGGVDKLLRLELSVVSGVGVTSPTAVVVAALTRLHDMYDVITHITTYCTLCVRNNLTQLSVAHIVAKIVIQIAAVSRIWYVCRSLSGKLRSCYSSLLCDAPPNIYPTLYLHHLPPAL